MNAVEEITEKLHQPMEELVQYLEQTGQVEAHSFFVQAQHRLAHVSEEDELLELFLMLAMTAFQGFAMDPFGAMMADRILAYAQQVSHAFSASDETAH